MGYIVPRFIYILVFVLYFIWKQLKGISSAVTKGEKTKMFYIGGNIDIISFLLCRIVIIAVALILLKSCILAEFVSFLKFTQYMYA